MLGHLKLGRYGCSKAPQWTIHDG